MSRLCNSQYPLATQRLHVNFLFIQLFIILSGEDNPVSFSKMVTILLGYHLIFLGYAEAKQTSESKDSD